MKDERDIEKDLKYMELNQKDDNKQDRIKELTEITTSTLKKLNTDTFMDAKILHKKKRKGD
ncbi:MAG: hypothetical protein HWN81_13025 [Candidatus Lokiarchaeota archaeon]|nr:hypothetical protein [Candidatus Lokiarchaeota archaeon]